MINFDNKSILDFWGNFGTLDHGFGNILEYKDDIRWTGHLMIDPKDYTCIDVDKNAMDRGREKYPDAEWIYYNRYNPMYNPNGQKNLLPKVNKKYDLIYSYGVFAHTTYEELLEFIDFFKTILTENGQIWLSIPCHGDPIIKWFYDKRIKQYSECDNIFEIPENYTYLVDNKIKKEVSIECKYLVTIYNKKFLTSLGEVITVHFPQSFLKII